MPVLRISLTILVATSALLAFPQKPVPPAANTLTPAEIEEGWLLLFDGATTFGWSTEGPASVKEGVLSLGGQEAARAATTSTFGRFQLQLDWQLEGAREAKFQLGKTELSLAATEAGKFSSSSFVFDSTTQRGGVSFQAPAGGRLLLRNIKLRPLDLKSIFDGRTLNGWRAPASGKTKATLNDGELHLQGGPGELSTEKSWGDFILRLDIKANAPQVRSGIFLRATPEETESGYEVQIRNQWQGNDRAKPIDFGTGGLHNRQSARRVMPNDGEWFSETIVAEGNHLAVWVNGSLVCDFTDKRPAARTARQGAKLGKGVIALQGEDLGTNVNFRHIELAELP